ncbi:hypothetical protein N0V83_007821 [Neocucurbitaria cava]|uniref:RING-type domain-containing protein n=1 Tax=Neocucurbitaria cava TaxID=798079 RepID=A0A9W8Y4A5_9PLEO|nr:hypothetical protein N0V83_007821 [Neocucurbitaria cava]
MEAAAGTDYYQYSVNLWIRRLKRSTSCVRTMQHSSDPYQKAMHVFQNFTDSVIYTLENISSLEDAIDLNSTAWDHLYDFYGHLSNYLSTYSEYWDWVKEATLVHPHRRSDEQYLWLEIVALQQDGRNRTVQELIHDALQAQDAWIMRVLAHNSLLRDPDELYYFHHMHGLRVVRDVASNPELDADCLTCAEAFDDKSHTAQQAPCGHVLCSSCFHNWLHDCPTDVYTCPMCRACLICGANNCQYHDIEREKIKPYPLLTILDSLSVGNENDLFRGLVPNRYWELREVTREDRVKIGWLFVKMRYSGSGEEDPVYRKFQAGYNDLVDGVKQEFERVQAHSQVAVLLDEVIDKASQSLAPRG